MNKKLHLFLFCLLLIVIICLYKEKILEPFGNQIVIHPDNASFDPQETTFSVLTYDSDLGSDVTQASICSDDGSWRNGDKTCLNYSLTGSNCEDIGDDGRLAFDACKVACDNCNTYTEVRRNLPSPIEDTDEPSYAQFESSASGGDFGSVGGVDIREILGKLEELENKMNLLITDGDEVTETPEIETPEIETPETEPTIRTGYCSGNTDTTQNPDIICSNGYRDKTGKRGISGRTVGECCDIVEEPEPIDCIGEWSEWSECSAPCDGGTQNRTYTITTSAEYGGSPCVSTDNTEGTGDCNTQQCDTCSSYQCPDNYAKRGNIDDTTCGKVSCDEGNRDTCCVIIPEPEPAPEPEPEPEPEPDTSSESEDEGFFTLRNILIILVVVLTIILVIWGGLLAWDAAGKITFSSSSKSAGRTDLTESLLGDQGGDQGGGLFEGMTLLS